MRAKIVSSDFVKTPLLVIVLCIACHWVHAQDLPTDAGKVLFYDVVQADSLSKDRLLQNAQHWLTTHSFDKKTDSTTAEGFSITAANQLPVYATGYVSKKQNGIVTYTVQIEVKDNKYRYWFTNFVFHYYRENRNYQLVPTGKTKPLEETTANGWQKTWDFNRKTTGQHITSLIKELKTDMNRRPVTEKPAVVQKKEW
jgi:hypothetical protein